MTLTPMFRFLRHVSITVARIENNRAVGYDVFAEGWLQGLRAWGRPADVLVMPDGALLVSDDRQGAIYRISYGGEVRGPLSRLAAHRRAGKLLHAPVPVTGEAGENLGGLGTGDLLQRHGRHCPHLLVPPTAEE